MTTADKCPPVGKDAAEEPPSAPQPGALAPSTDRAVLNYARPGNYMLPDRIRGDALRRSMYYCTLGWVFGAFWFAATNGATINRFTEYLAPASQKDLILAFVTAAGSIGVLLQIPGAFVIEHLGRRKKFFI